MKFIALLALTASTAAAAPALRTESAPVGRELEATAQCLVPEWHFDFPGNDVSNQLTSLDDCCALCSKTEACNAYTWTKYQGGSCYLKTKKASSVWAGTLPDGAAYTISAQVYKCQALQQDRDLAGADLKNVPAPQAEACCAECRQTPKCTGFAWNSYNGGTCWLKSGALMPVAFPNTISAKI